MNVRSVTASAPRAIRSSCLPTAVSSSASGMAGPSTRHRSASCWPAARDTSTSSRGRGGRIDGASDGICDRPTLELKSRGKSAALADLYVHCKTLQFLGVDGRCVPSREPQGHEAAVAVRPWLHDRQPDCDAPPESDPARCIERALSGRRVGSVDSAGLRRRRSRSSKGSG